jgi:hypothetical protein
VSARDLPRTHRNETVRGTALLGFSPWPRTLRYFSTWLLALVPVAVAGVSTSGPQARPDLGPSSFFLLDLHHLLTSLPPSLLHHPPPPSAHLFHPLAPRWPPSPHTPFLPYHPSVAANLPIPAHCRAISDYIYPDHVPSAPSIHLRLSSSFLISLHTHLSRPSTTPFILRHNTP